MDNEPPPLPEAYGDIVRKHCGGLGMKVLVEPGRLIVGNAGILVTSVIYVKGGDHKNFVIVDAAMNDLIRPTLYDAYHHIEPVVEADINAPRITADIVGPVCETGDYLALDREMQLPEPGDLLVRQHGWRIWRGTVRHLQHTTSGARSARQWRSVPHHSPAPDL